MVKNRFTLKNGNASEGEDVDNDLDEVEKFEWDGMFIETEASKHTHEGDVAVIKTGDDHPYYLLKVTAFCVIGNCPELPSTQQKKRGKNVKMFIVNHDIHQALYQLAISE